MEIYYFPKYLICPLSDTEKSKKYSQITAAKNGQIFPICISRNQISYFYFLKGGGREANL